jgi:hypothetical protein
VTGLLLAVAVAAAPLGPALDRAAAALERLACYDRAVDDLRAADREMSLQRRGSALYRAAGGRWLVAYRDLAACRVLDNGRGWR